MRRFISALAVIAIAGSIATSPVAAGAPEARSIATGLDHPRGIDVGPDGAIYVAEAGSAGDDCLGPSGICVGSTGAVTRIGPDGSLERIVTGLPSIAIGNDLRGPSDVVVRDDELYVVVSLGAHPALRDDLPAEAGARTGWLLRVAPDGSVHELADIASFEAEVDPDGRWPGSRVESDPRSVALSDGAFVVADSGGNSLLLVDEAGTISLIATFPPVEAEVPGRLPLPLRLPDPEEGGPLGGAVPLPEPGGSSEDEAPAVRRILVEAMPTTVAVGPDGAFYVGLNTDSPFIVGGASVARIEAGGRPTPYTGGFTSIVDIAFGPEGHLYVLEQPAAALLDGGPSASARGALWRVPPGGEPELILSEPLESPAGLAVASDGVIYVTDGMTSGVGSVLRVEP